MRPTRGTKARRGVSATELAIILPALAFLGLVCVDFGRFAYHYVAVTNAARAGAEYGITHPYVSSGQSSWQTQVQLAAQGELEGQTDTTPTDLTTEVTTTDANGQRRIRVVASYTGFRTVVSWPGIPAAPTLRAAVEMEAIR